MKPCKFQGITAGSQGSLDKNRLCQKCIYVYVYIYIYSKTDRQIDRQTDRQRHRHKHHKDLMQKRYYKSHLNY